MTYYPSVEQMTQDIIAEARANRVDPNVALRVARAEGLKPGVWQSNFKYGPNHRRAGQREKSYSPWQMNVDSPNALGSKFYRDTGKDPSDPANWQAVNKYAVAHASKNGWKDWMGAKAAGVGPMDGLNSQSPVPPGVLDQQLDMNNMQKPGNPMQMAMQGGIPGMAEQFQMAGAVPPTPMQQAMQQGGYVDPSAPHLGAVGSQAPMPQEGNGPNWGDAFMSLGAGLSSIDNPSGAAAIVAMMRNKQGKRFSFQQQWDGSLAKVDSETGNIEIVRGPNRDLMDKKSGITNQVEAESKAQGALNGWGDMQETAKSIRGDAALGKITGWNSYVPNLPGGEAKALQAKLDNFKSKGVFTVLQNLRDMSQTGGALGQVSNYENVLMEKAFGALEQAQSAEDFAKAMDAFIAQSARSMANVSDAYEKQYGRKLPGYQPIGPEAPAAPAAPPAGSGFSILSVE
jgi:hypothetical protein